MNNDTPADAMETLEKMLASRRQQLASCERMLELLQPEWDRFEAKAGHDIYVARDYAEHTSAARTHRKEIAALEYATHTPSLAAQDGLIDALRILAEEIAGIEQGDQEDLKLYLALLYHLQDRMAALASIEVKS